MSTVESFLEHHGVKGMKWGVRKARHRAQINRNDYDIARLKAKRDSKSGDGKNLLTMSAIELAMKAKNPDKFANMMNTQISALEAQNERIKTGRTTILDKIDSLANVSVLELAAAKAQIKSETKKN